MVGFLRNALYGAVALYGWEVLGAPAPSTGGADISWAHLQDVRKLVGFNPAA